MLLATLLATLAPQCSETSFTPQLASSDRIGSSVAIDGDIALFTETDVSGNFIGPDEVVVHEFIHGGWTSANALPLPSNFTATDRFGTRIAVSGETIAVLHVRGNQRTDVVVYRRVTGAWLIEDVLSPAPGQYGDGLALDGDRLAVGVRVAASLEGRVFVYERTGSTWNLDEVVAPTTVPDVEFLGFGQSIDLDGDRMAVGTFPLGAPFQSGAAYVMERTAAGWTEAGFLVAPSLSVGDRFGMDVAIDGDWVVVGAERDTLTTFQGGAVHAFERTASGWTFRESLDTIAGSILGGGLGDAKLGADVDISGDVAVASLTRQNGAVRGGGVQVWRLENGAWESQGVVRAIDPSPRDRFSTVLALDGQRLVTSRPEFDAPTRGFVFENIADCTYPQPLGDSVCDPAVPNSSGLPARMSAEGHPAASSGVLTLRTHDLPQFTVGYYLTSMTQGMSMPPGSDGVLCLGGSIGRFNDFVVSSGSAGEFVRFVHLGSMPTTPTQPVLSGQTWLFQAWFRDTTPNPATSSNFSDAVEITFL